MSTPNAELAYKVLDLAKENGESFGMGSWAWSPDREAVDLDDLTKNCGTTACLAGWTAAVMGFAVDSRGSVYDASGNEVSGAVDLFAGAALGLGDKDISDLFYCADDMVDFLVAKIFGPRPVDWDKPLEPVMGVPASGCDCSHDGGHGLTPWPDRARGHADDCPAYVPLSAGSAS